MTNSAFAWFKLITDHYNEFLHIPVTMTICAMGVVANTLNVIVLRHQSMIGSTTTILTGIAITQLGLLMQRFTFGLRCGCGGVGTLERMYRLTHRFLDDECTILLAVFRLILLKWPLESTGVINAVLARRVCLIASGSVILMCLPVYLCTVVNNYTITNSTECDVSEGSNKTMYILDLGPAWALEVTMWFYGVVMKVIPCVLVTILCCVILRVVQTSGQRQIGNRFQYHGHVLPGLAARAQHRTQIRNRICRTTKLLLVIVSLCALVELPNGVMCCIVAVMHRDFAYEVYNQMGDIFDMLTLLYSAINFILYCTISSMFREAFRLTFTKTTFVISRRTTRRSTTRRLNQRNGTNINRNHHYASTQF